MPPSQQELLRRIPSVDALLQEAEARWCPAGTPRRIVVECVRAAAEDTRKHLLDGTSCSVDPEGIRRTILDRADAAIREALGPHHRKVVNAAGIILHTALGRAVLPQKAIRQIQEELSGYSLVQADLQTGQRSRRDERIERLLQQLTGAEAATVVNNNAAATAIVLSTVAKGREVIVSRGQLVEIGGSFRLPDVMAAAGADLIEVGTTNKTHLRDYERAITENTAAILRVHPSNYKILGFTAEVPLDELVELAHARGLVLIDDVGAGSLVDFSRFGFEAEPTLPESVRTRGRPDYLERGQAHRRPPGRDHPRPGRPDPSGPQEPPGTDRPRRQADALALEATLSLFLDEALALREIPTLRMLCRGLGELGEQAERMAQAIAQRSPAPQSP